MRFLLNTITTDLAKRGQLQTATNRSIIIVVEMQNSSVLFGAASDNALATTMSRLIWGGVR
jgi:hypothetical protein